MKPATVFLGEMTSPEVERFLTDHDIVIIPTGSTEQHGPHGPLATDTLVPTEIARRVAPVLGAAVGPPLTYGLSYPHTGFSGVVSLRQATFAALIEDLCENYARMGFRRIVFLNGHWDNTYPIAYACANAADKMPAGARAFPITYWESMNAEETAEFFILHANRSEMSAVLAINPDLVDMEVANVELPPFPEMAAPTAVHTAFFYPNPGSIRWASASGTWGDAREASVEFGQRFLDVVTASTIRLFNDIERAFAAMPPR